MEAYSIRSMEERVYEMVPVDQIKVLNSRDRDEEQFRENVRSIDQVGLRKPVVVNAKHHKRTGHYELICGEGRYLAYKRLGKDKIPAEVISCDRKTALLYSLVENIARVPPGTMWFAREVKRMHDAGWKLEDICRVVGKCESYVRDYLRLAEQGEERLIRGVEQGLFPMTFALLVARSDSSNIQNVLMDAFDSGMVNSSNLPSVRRIVDARASLGKDHGSNPNRSGKHPAPYSLKQLKSDIARITKEKEAFVHEVGVKENRLVALLQDLHALWENESFVALVREEGLEQWPELKGTYTV